MSLLLLPFCLVLLTACTKYDFSDPDKAVETVSITSINPRGATCSANIISNGGYSIVERGICWSLAKEPTISNSIKRDSKNTLGNFTLNITSLTAGKTYFIRAYAKTSQGYIAYGNQLVFSTLPKGLSSISTSVDSTVYINYKMVKGIITNDGGDVVTSRGFCWDTFPNPTIAKYSNIIGSGAGTFSSNISVLLPNRKYYVKAWAKNSIGISYGNEISFTTGQPQLAFLNISATTNISRNSATSGGFVSLDGGANIIARGVCWSLISKPTITDYKTLDGVGLGSFSSFVTGLIANKTYYIRAYATNSVGTSYSNEINFVTLPLGLPLFGNQIFNSVSYNIASVANNISDDGGANILSRGVCWSSSSTTPTILNSKTTDGTGLGNYTSTISGLTPGSVYFIRGYATNSVGTVYSNTLNLTTLNYALATLFLKSVAFVSKASVSCQSTISTDGGTPITARGVCWNTSPNPTLSNYKTSDGVGIGTFTSSITGLTAGLTYYIRTYAVNGTGISYSSQYIYSN